MAGRYLSGKVDGIEACMCFSICIQFFLPARGTQGFHIGAKRGIITVTAAKGVKETSALTNVTIETVRPLMIVIS